MTDLELSCREMKEIQYKHPKINVIAWVKDEGYRVKERLLGSFVNSEGLDKSNEIYCYVNNNDYYKNIIKESDELKEYDGIVEDYEFNRQLFYIMPVHEITRSCYEAMKYLKENMTDEWSRSPYGYSFYSSKDIDWGYKPEGSLRVSDHWNFGEDGEHCPTAEPVDGWAVCKFENGKYHLIKKF